MAKSETGFWVTIGYKVESDSVTKEELIKQANQWVDNNSTLVGFTLTNGEQPHIQEVHREWDDC